MQVTDSGCFHDDQSVQVPRREPIYLLTLLLVYWRLCLPAQGLQGAGHKALK